MFEILDQLNIADTADGTSKVGVLPDVISVNMYTNHGDIKFGLPVDVARKLTLESSRYKPIMLVVDMEEYNKIDKT